MFMSEQPPKSENYKAFEAALEAAQAHHLRQQDEKRKRQKPIGWLLLFGGIASFAAGVILFLGVATGDRALMNFVYGTFAFASGIAMGIKGFFMLRGHLSGH
jgi:uncharacterized membrane protein HdeD (DUF308 family)